MKADCTISLQLEEDKNQLVLYKKPSLSILVTQPEELGCHVKHFNISDKGLNPQLLTAVAF